MPVADEPRVYEIRIHGFTTCAEALALQDPVARLLCPVEEHDGPCDVPWEFTVGAPDEESDGEEKHEDDEDDDDGEGDDDATVLVLGVYTSGTTAAEVADRVRALVGEKRPVDLRPGDPEQFEVLVEQYRIESAMDRD